MLCVARPEAERGARLSVLVALGAGPAAGQQPPRAVETVPGMPPVTDPANLYSETRTDRMSPAVANALPRVYVPNLKSNDVYVIDPATFKVVDKFKVGINPQHIVPSWDLKTLWVTNNAEGRTDGSLTPIDPTTGKPGKAVAVDDPYNMYFSPDGRSAIVVAEALKRLDLRDPQTMALQSSIAVPQCAGINHADFSIDGKFAIFTCEFQGSLAKIDLVGGKVLGYLKLSKGGMPQDIRVSPDGKIFYVADMKADGIFVIDGDSFKEIGFIQTGKGTHGLYPSRDGSEALRGQSRLQSHPRQAAREGKRVRGGLRHPPYRGQLAHPRRRQPGHGQRERGRQDALALRPLRQRRLRHRHHLRRGPQDPRGQGAPRPHRSGPSPAATPWPHR